MQARPWSELRFEAGSFVLLLGRGCIERTAGNVFEERVSTDRCVSSRRAGTFPSS